MDNDGKSYGKEFRDLCVGLNVDTSEMLRIHHVLRTPRQLELVCIFGSPQCPNARNNDKTLFSMAVDGVLEIKRRYMHESMEEVHWDTIGEDFDFAWMDVLPVEVKKGILYVKNQVFELNILLQDYKEKTVIQTSTLIPA